jgi:hypothetical protein
MTTPSSGPSGFNRNESAQGGADAVPDTVQAAGRGADPNRPEQRGTPRAAPGGGMGKVVWIVAAVAAVIAAVFASGLFR